MTETCNAVGYLTVGGRKVGLLKCDGREGHDTERRFWGSGIEALPTDASWDLAPARYGATPHSMTLRWDAEVPGIDWPEALDPEETFDVEVPLARFDAMPSHLCGIVGCYYDAGHMPADVHSWTRADQHAARDPQAE